MMMAAEEVADVRSPGGQRNRIPHGNMRAKLLNYIGQVYECKADSPHYCSRRGIANWLRKLARARGERPAVRGKKDAEL
jgi:hypothetical protein